ncbi:hypothetical protein Moror_5297 [Moniliophthora roreri MCA 2997]|uniref:MYND-type domain-containing protein n=1 Tax=Moniliophthora roreri (strain MCA 2997) TaxID=1381753 RepID=V2YBT3_MONRO|nr:hypothetical protein Moror_5297 [Moniliophthora roreri MCA 2997]
MNSFEARLNRPEQSFSESTTQGEKFSALSAFLSDEIKHDSTGLPFAYLSGSTSNPPAFVEREVQCRGETRALFRFLERHDISPTSLISLVKPTQFSDPPICKRLPCAYHNAETRIVCANNGTRSCSGCRLVRYCSKECQKRDWEKHKQDCRNQMRDDSWRPLWEEQRREPAFVSEPKSCSPLSSFGGGVTLWGNVPAINVLSDTIEDESIKARDFRLAFIASGDLRNMIKTVNSLPDEYNGNLTIVLNDRNPLVVARNVLILSALGLMEDMDQAIDFALHFWYSVFLPTKGSALAFASLYQHLIADHPFDGRQISLSTTSTLSMMLSPLTIQTITLDLEFGNTVDPGTANNTLNAVMNAPERVDYRDRVYARLKPSHRVAIQEWRRFGLLMPFGAPNAHLNRPNPSLITPTGHLWLNDSANPLEGWEYVPRFDMLPCVTNLENPTVFAKSSNLAKNTERLRKISWVAFTSTCRTSSPHSLDDCASSPSHSECMTRTLLTWQILLPPHLCRFDRVEVSNIMDLEYVGVASVLTKWGPMLDREQPDSTLIGSFINWAYRTPGARASSTVSLVAPCMKHLLTVRPELAHPFDVLSGSFSADAMTAVASMEIVHDNSPAFKKYLMSEGANQAARRGGVRMRERNKIAPPRPFVPIHSEWSTLPDISTKEKWYNKVNTSFRFRTVLSRR